MKTNLIPYLTLFVVSLFFISCEDETVITSSDLGKSEGKIKVTLDGTTKDGESLEDESFKATKYEKGNYSYSNRISKNDSIYNIQIRRTKNVISWKNYGSLKIEYNRNQDVAVLKSFEMAYEKRLEDQTMLNLVISKYWYGYGPDTNKQISDFTLDEETYELSGKFSISYIYQNKNTINTEVEFSAQPIKIIN